MKKWKIADKPCYEKEPYIKKPELKLLMDILSKFVAFSNLIGSLIKYAFVLLLHEHCLGSTKNYFLKLNFCYSYLCQDLIVVYL